MATGDLTSLENAKAICGLDVANTGADDMLKRLVTAASAFFVQRVQRPILTTSHVDTISGDGSDSLPLGFSPVVAVQSLVIDGATIPERTTVSGEGWVRVGDVLHLIGYSFTKGVANVVVTYTAGYGLTAPPDVEQAVLELVQFRFKSKDRASQASRSMPGGEVLTFWGYEQATASVNAVINLYRQGWVA